MTGTGPGAEVAGLRDQLRVTATDQHYVQYDADPVPLLKMSDNIRLVPSNTGVEQQMNGAV